MRLKLQIQIGLTFAFLAEEIRKRDKHEIAREQNVKITTFGLLTEKIRRSWNDDPTALVLRITIDHYLIYY